MTEMWGKVLCFFGLHDKMRDYSRTGGLGLSGWYCYRKDCDFGVKPLEWPKPVPQTGGS